MLFSDGYRPGRVQLVRPGILLRSRGMVLWSIRGLETCSIPNPALKNDAQAMR